MADIEKVKQGLKQHHAGICTEKYGTICPYWECEASCSKELMADALSVIEQMEHDIQSCIADLHHYQKDSKDLAKRWEKSKDYNVELQEEVKRLKAERRWIPVSERLPDEYTNVLVMSKRFEEPKIDQMWIIGGEKIWTLDNVTHWMPLPQPPKEGEQG